MVWRCPGLEGGRLVVPEGLVVHDGGCGALATSVNLLQRLLKVVRAQEAAAVQREHRAKLLGLRRSSGCSRQEQSWPGARRCCRDLLEKKTVATEAKRCSKPLNLFLIA